ncbi:MAG: ATP-binding protein [Bacteroidales bacterium]|nr:ATP-binding protein [Bacteroidales bacterium]
MGIKIGKIYRLTNRYVEIVFFEDVFSKPISNQNRLDLAGMINTYVTIPLYNGQEAIGIIFEQLNGYEENDFFNRNPDRIISKVRIIGTYNPIKNNFKKGIDFYPTIETEVFTIDERRLDVIYNSSIDLNEPKLEIGTDIFFPTVSIYADPNVLFGKHLAVFGNTGSGKSCTVTSILQGIYNPIKNRLHNSGTNKLKTILIDSNDEYKNVFDGIDDVSIQKVDIESLELSHKDLKFFELTQLLNETSPNVTPYLREAVVNLKGGQNVDTSVYYNFVDLPDAIRQAVRNNNAPNNVNFTLGFCSHLINRINGFINDDRLKCIFSSRNNTIEEFLNSDKSILILSLQVASDVLSIITYLICKSVYFHKVSNRDSESLLLILEEAHRYISNNGGDLINNFYVEKVAREGRKFGVNLLVSTQRPSEVSQTVISQCNSIIVHKITNSRDLEFIRNTIEYEDKNQIDLLTSLKQQQALVLGEAFSFSSLIRISDADPLPKSETPKIFNNE